MSNLCRGISSPSKRPKRTCTKNWGKLESNLVLHLRKKEPNWGKQKIAKVLNRDHDIKISDSTVGRILKILRERGLITKTVSAVRTKKKRSFNRHAIPWWFKDYKTFEIGERVQIDHMTAIKNQTTCKHFQAWDRKSKYIDADVFSSATSKSAKTFLHNFIFNAPFPIKSIQVDGGSEFRGDFEDACAELIIPLIVLPPAKPTYNGGVERGNRIFREEFYARKDIISDSIDAIRYDLKQQVKKYNTYRPHSGLNLLTPMEYINNNLESSY